MVITNEISFLMIIVISNVTPAEILLMQILLMKSLMKFLFPMKDQSKAKIDITVLSPEVHHEYDYSNYSIDSQVKNSWTRTHLLIHVSLHCQGLK
jgi:hypothetical protein